MAQRDVFTRDQMRKWLVAHGFVALKGGSTSHKQYKHEPEGLVITLTNHGPREINKGNLSSIIRQLESIGFKREEIREELRQY